MGKPVVLWNAVADSSRPTPPVEISVWSMSHSTSLTMRPPTAFGALQLVAPSNTERRARIRLPPYAGIPNQAKGDCVTGFPGLRVGDRVKYYRKTNGNRSQAVVAGLCGITERYLSMIENGQKTPSANVLSRLASELGVPIASLLSDSHSPEPVATDRTAPDVARALMGYARQPISAPVVPEADLRERVEPRPHTAHQHRRVHQSTHQTTGTAHTTPPGAEAPPHPARLRTAWPDPVRHLPPQDAGHLQPRQTALPLPLNR
ncbi:helix-turn-helix domain-containing protein [Streptomyces sp. NPDC056909]|uniref:helix-turn-helix domain-containing protein n=1 Tax=Streptomyces sp. NPDC056909 TaxID=3345963 RepID=UPI0036B91420